MERDLTAVLWGRAELPASIAGEPAERVHRQEDWRPNGAAWQLRHCAARVLLCSNARPLPGWQRHWQRLMRPCRGARLLAILVPPDGMPSNTDAQHKQLHMGCGFAMLAGMRMRRRIRRSWSWGLLYCSLFLPPWRLPALELCCWRKPQGASAVGAGITAVLLSSVCGRQLDGLENKQ